jgi:hypothetical protein
MDEMVISELIGRLLALLAANGDLPIGRANDEFHCYEVMTRVEMREDDRYDPDFNELKESPTKVKKYIAID